MSTIQNFVIPTSQLLLDSEFSQSVKWNERTLTDKSASQSLSWQNRIGYNADGDESLNWNSTTLFDTAKVQALIWKNRATYDSNGSQSLDWDNKVLGVGWTIAELGTDDLSLCTYGQMVSSSGGSGSVSFPLDTLNTNLSLLQAHASSQKVLISSNGATIMGTDTDEQPYIQEPNTGHRFGFDDGASPIVSGVTNYGLLKVSSIGDLHTEASIAFFNINTQNSNADYWVAGVDVGNDAGNGNFNVWNGANNVVVKIRPNGDFNTAGTIVDQNGSQSIDFNNRYAADPTGNAILEWVGQSSDDSYTGGIIFAPSPGVGLCSIQNSPGVPSCSVDSNFFFLNDISGSSSVDWDHRLLIGDWGIFGTVIDGEQTGSIDINDRYLLDSTGNAAIQWGDPSQVQINPPIVANSFKDGAGFNVIDLVGRSLYANDGGFRLQWSGSFVYVPELNATNFDVVTITNTNFGFTSTVLDATNRLLKDGNGVSVINFQANSAGGDTASLLTVDSNAHQVTVNASVLSVSGSLTIQSPIISSGTQAVADGTYTVGTGVTNNGTITIKNGIIVAVQEAS